MDTGARQAKRQTSHSSTELFTRRRVMAHMLNESGYLRYLRALWRSTAAFGWYTTALTLFRRIRLLRLIVRIVQGLWLALQTGTLVLLLLPLLLVLVPGLLLLSVLMLLGGVMELRRIRAVMTARMRGKTVVFLQADVGLWEGERDVGSFFRGQLRELDAQENVLAFVLSPYLFSKRGFGGRGFYWALRREAKRVYLVRTYGYFALRGIARRAAQRVILVA